MNREVVKCGLFLLGGIAIGAIGATVVSRGKLKGIKPCLLYTSDAADD